MILGFFAVAILVATAGGAYLVGPGDGESRGHADGFATQIGLQYHSTHSDAAGGRSFGIPVPVSG